MSEINKHDALNEDYQALVEELIEVTNDLSSRFANLFGRYSDLTSENVADMEESVRSIKSEAELNDAFKNMQSRQDYLLAKAKAQSAISKSGASLVISLQLNALKDMAKVLK